MQSEQKCISRARRTFLQGAIVVSGSLISPSVRALPPYVESPEPYQSRHLRLANMHTGELLDIDYWKSGRYIDDHVGQLNYFMRDHRENKSTLMDKNLYDFLYRLYSVLDTEQRIHVLSAYRTEATNALLMKKSNNVAKRSFHVAGKAIDFYIPGIENQHIQREARRLILGGVGHYAKAGFIHLDTGYPRHWVNS